MTRLASSASIEFPARPGVGLSLAIGLIAGSIIALQIGIMRIFAVGSWAHFGSLVVSLAMLGFGLSSVVMSLAKDWFEARWQSLCVVFLLAYGPLLVLANLGAQELPFNAIFLASDPNQGLRLLANFLLYLLPFLSGAFFLGTVFLKAGPSFGRIYFADLTGSGLAGLVVLGAMYICPPEQILAVPLVLWALGTVLWIASSGIAARLTLTLLTLAVAALSMAGYILAPQLLHVPDIAVSQYKGVAYARNFPDAQRIYRSISPFGDLQVYSSSYMHFAPGLSDNASFNLAEMPRNAYVGLYLDGDGPDGILRKLPKEAEAYFRYLPSYYPYLLKQNPKTFVVQFGGGTSTLTALHAGASSVTAAQNNPAVLTAFSSPALREVTGDILADPRLKIVDYDGRLFLAHTNERYDVIDLSLADSVGLSNPGGFAIVEKYAYTSDAMLSYMRALSDGGILSITLWNKEEPPKSILKFYATVADAALKFAPERASSSLYVVSSYLATTTVLYKKGGFTPEDLAKLRANTKAMSFDEIYPVAPQASPQAAPQADVASLIEQQAAGVLDAYRASIFSVSPAQKKPVGVDGLVDPTADLSGEEDAAPAVLPATALARLAWPHLLDGTWGSIAAKYVFDSRPLTNDRPYFAAYVRLLDLPKTLDHLDVFQDEWGYLLLWATLAIACFTAIWLVVLPMIFGWRSNFAYTPGKIRSIIYFGCLGLGYIMVEVGLISRFTLALSNPTVSASILITGMLIFSGLGSLVSERIIPRAKLIMPLLFLSIFALLVGYGMGLAPVLDWIGVLPYATRLALCFALAAPPAFLMGFPMATGMAWLAKRGKEGMFVWAWGINGCFSVIGAACVPIVATAFGLPVVLYVAAAAYLLALPAFYAVLLPRDDE